MKPIVVALAFAATTLSAAAQDGLRVRPLIGTGLTFGGDKIATVDFTNGDSESIYAGGLVMFYAGAEWRFDSPFALQTTIGYHVDDSSGRNGSLRFSRYPVDVIGLYAINERVRLGGGIEYVSSPKVGSSGVLAGNSERFKASTGLVLEGEYLFTPQFGLKARVASHEFDFKNGPGSIDGNYFGVLANFYFR
jgi:hypothetical protein